jgi:hypothetical protein
MAYPVPHIKRVGENVIRVYHPEVVEPSTYLTATVAASGTTLTVKSNLGFSNDDPQDLLLFEGFGSEGAEIKRINGAITAGTSLTVAAVTFNHAIDTRISKVLFNQVELSGATALAGSKTSIATVAINVSGLYTDYIVTGTTYAFYFARFYNSLATTPYYGGYSDGISASDYDTNTVGYVKRNAFSTLNEEPGEKFSDVWIFDKVYEGERDVTKRLKRWSWLINEDYDAGNAATGVISFTLPTNIEDNKTNKSILGLRIGTGENLEYLGKAEYEERQVGVAHTTTSTTATIGATTLVLTDSRDFDDSGSVNIAGTSYTYTANTRSTGTLSGLTALAAEITSGTDVWQDATFGEPRFYTVIEGDVYLDVPVSSDFNGRNIWLDYYITPTKANSDGDALTVNDPMVIQLYLEREIKRKKLSGELPKDDISNVLYEQRVALLIMNELSGQPISLRPVVPDRLPTHRGYRR